MVPHYIFADKCMNPVILALNSISKFFIRLYLREELYKLQRAIHTAAFVANQLTFAGHK